MVCRADDLPLFDAGKRQAQLDATEAAYLQTVARYRGTVLKAIQEVEENLSLLRSLKNVAVDVEAGASCGASRNRIWP